MFSEQRDFNPTQWKNQSKCVLELSECLLLLEPASEATSCLTSEEVGKVILEAAKFAAQAHLFTRRAANSTLAYTQRQILKSVSEILHATVSPLSRLGRTMASHEATRSREAEPEISESEFCAALQLGGQY